MQGIRKALNDALCLQGLNELSTMTIPLQSPSNWQPGPWTADLTTDVSCSMLSSQKLWVDVRANYLIVFQGPSIESVCLVLRT